MHTLARYRVLRPLGAGAAGGVYLVEDRVLGGPALALKRVEQASDVELRDSFAREFAVLASLSVPGVARVHDLGVMPATDGLSAGPFFTRDYIEGEPLSSWARERASDEIARVFSCVLETVGMLHARGVVHGDLKPANIIVDRDGAPHVIDFGLASRLSQRLTGSGTPLFMAPELFGGASSSMSTDVYALGATLWAALRGTAPLEELGARAIAAKLRGELPELPSELEPRRRALLEVARCALAPDPRERAPSTDELAARLERASGQPRRERAPFVLPRPRGREELVERLARREDASPLLVLHGARGMGKSTLLCELKWRLQLAGAPVLEVRARSGTFAPLGQLVRQLALRDDKPELLALEERAHQDGAQGALIAALVTALVELPGAVLLVDDLESADALFSELVRALLHEGVRAPRILASAASLAALASLVDFDAFALPPLTTIDQRALIEEALGPVDDTTSEALIAHAAGNPGVLVEALAWLFERGDPSARSLQDIAPGEIGAGLAEARFAALSGAAQDLLCLLALARAPLASAWLAQHFGAAFASARSELAGAGLVREEAEGIFASEAVVNDWLRGPRLSARASELAARALSAPHAAQLDAVTHAELARIAGDDQQLGGFFESALESLLARGALARAVQLGEACLARGLGGRELELRLGELLLRSGDCARAIELTERVLSDATLDERTATRARLAAARAHVASGTLERAVELLSSWSKESPAPLAAQAARELARVHLRRGESAQAKSAVERGLRAAQASDPARAELLAIEATLASQAGDHDHAEPRFEEALALARALAAVREQALVFGYRALSHERRGALELARADYEAGLALARRSGDLGMTATYASNLGNVCFRAGVLEGVEQHYTLASRLARRSGREGMALLADFNLAHLHLHLGSYTRARVLAEATLGEAQRLGDERAEAHALHVLAGIDVRVGAREAALARFEASALRFLRLGRTHDLAEVWLDVAETLLDRGGVSDVSAASARLAQAREQIERHGHDEFRPRLRLLIARARAGNGDVEGALRELADVERAVASERELAWQVLAAQAALHAQLGANVLAARKAREAAELIELMATRAPREAREAFLADPRRRAVLELARATLESSQRGTSSELLSEPRFVRLLELIKRLARERDLDRLLERITDAAVDLSGAERGFVLLVDASGQLAPHTVRTSGGAETDPLVAFSRSIAEAVLIDGEPIVTVNARDDRRLNEFMSVHKLMLKSVACIPISGPRGVVGVLYLEHRMRAGRFQESEVELLLAFADQAAIAIENARLWSDNERRQRELEAQAAELARAKADIERLLETRTEELEQVRRDLGRARAELENQGTRHGIVGRSPAMQRVYALIDRVADSPVPVVIEGESGTGKELVARAIHFASNRKKEPFVAINCAALPEPLLESELFGHVRGAFTGADRDKRGLFAQAHGGTIFLDEFADAPARMQIDLLRVLSERCIRPVGSDQDVPIDVRIVAASNRPLKQLVASGRLREDLYYRMSVVEIRLPALRERVEDVPALCDHLLTRLAERNGGRPRKLSRAALERIVASELPGNVRQLEHLLTSAAMLADGPLIEPSDLGLDPEPEPTRESAPPPERDSSLPNDVSGFKNREKQRILDALERHGWNRAKAATALGMPRRTFYRRLSEFNIL